MKPQPFAYLRAGSLAEALEVLAVEGERARALAGGQSLLPMMALRLAVPEVVVDVNGIGELAEVRDGADVVEVGALVRHRALERGAVPGSLGTLLREVAGHIGHLPVRVRGTLGGSIAHADPASEWCLAAVALGADVAVASRVGRRKVAAGELVEGPYTTALETGELICSLAWPRRAGWRYGFCEHARTRGAFAQAGACVGVEVSDGAVAGARVGVMGVSGRAERLVAVEGALIGAPAEEAGRLAAAATAEVVEPAGCGELSPAYLRALVATMVRRAVERAR